MMRAAKNFVVVLVSASIVWASADGNHGSFGKPYNKEQSTQNDQSGSMDADFFEEEAASIEAAYWEVPSIEEAASIEGADPFEHDDIASIEADYYGEASAEVGDPLASIEGDYDLFEQDVAMTEADFYGEASIEDEYEEKASIEGSEMAGQSHRRLNAWAEVKPYYASNLCWDMNGHTKDLVQWTCHGGNNQKFYYHSSQKIQILHSKRCVDYHYGNGNVFLHSCHDGNNQKWYQDAQGRIRSRHDGKCIESSGSGKGSTLRMRTCSNSRLQRFIYNSAWSMNHRSVVKPFYDTSLCWDVYAKSKDMMLYRCNSNENQDFFYIPENEMIYDASGYGCVDYNYGNGNLYIHRSCHGNSNQRFYQDDRGRLRSRYNNNKCIESSGGKEWSSLKMVDCSGSKYQRFRLPLSFEPTFQRSPVRPFYDSSKCWDVNPHSKDMLLYKCHQGKNQDFFYIPATEQIIDGSGFGCVDYSLQNGNVYVHQSCHGNNNQRFYQDERGRLRSRHDNKCLESAGGNDMSTLRMKQCSGSRYQRFILPGSFQATTQRSLVKPFYDSSKCWDVNPNSKDMLLYKCHQGKNQDFFYIPATEQIMDASGLGCIEYNTKNRNVYVYKCHAGANQKWFQHETGTIRSRHASSTCLESAGGNDMSTLRMVPCSDFSKYQMFNLPASFESTTKRSLVKPYWDSKMCWDVNPESKDMLLWECHGGVNQDFYYLPGTEQIVDGSGLGCVDYRLQNGNVYVQQSCHGNNNQRFYQDERGRLRSRHDNKCLQSSGGSKGSTLKMSDCSGSEHHMFRLPASFDPTRKRSVVKPSNDPNLCWDMRGSKDLYLYDCHGGVNQDFYYIPTTEQLIDGSGFGCVTQDTGNGNVYVDESCRNTPAQMWHQDDRGRFRSRQDGKCLSSEGNKGSTLKMVECSGSEHQKYKIPISLIELVKKSEIKPYYDGTKCMTAATGAKNGNVYVDSCNGKSNQQFVYFSDSMQLMPVSGGGCVIFHVENNNAILQPCKAQDDFKWRMDDFGRLQTVRYPERCLTRSDNNLVMQDCSGSKEQRFIVPYSFDRVSSPVISQSDETNCWSVNSKGNLFLSVCDRETNQDFFYVPETQHIMPASGGGCLVGGGDGFSVSITDCLERDDFRWQIDSLGRLHAKLKSEFCLGVEGTNLAMKTCTFDRPQRFSVPLSFPSVNTVADKKTAFKNRQKINDFYGSVNHHVYGPQTRSILRYHHPDQVERNLCPYWESSFVFKYTMENYKLSTAFVLEAQYTNAMDELHKSIVATNPLVVSRPQLIDGYFRLGDYASNSIYGPFSALLVKGDDGTALKQPEDFEKVWSSSIEQKKVVVCHGTASDTNPFVLIKFDESEVDKHFRKKQNENKRPDAMPGDLVKITGKEYTVKPDCSLCEGNGGCLQPKYGPTTQHVTSSTILYGPGETTKVKSWEEAQEFCTANGHEGLASSKDYCQTPDQSPPKPVFEIQGNNEWAPIVDSSNGWIQVGKSKDVETCATFQGTNGIDPDWGTNAASKEEWEANYILCQRSMASTWKPVAPDGYSCLGHVWQQSREKPSTDLIRCVHNNFVEKVKSSWTFRNEGSSPSGGAQGVGTFGNSNLAQAGRSASLIERDLSVWGTGSTSTSLTTGAFVSKASKSSPTTEELWALKKVCVVNQGGRFPFCGTDESLNLESVGLKTFSLPYATLKPCSYQHEDHSMYGLVNRPNSKWEQHAVELHEDQSGASVGYMHVGASKELGSPHCLGTIVFGSSKIKNDLFVHNITQAGKVTQEQAQAQRDRASGTLLSELIGGDFVFLFPCSDKNKIKDYKKTLQEQAADANTLGLTQTELVNDYEDLGEVTKLGMDPNHFGDPKWMEPHYCAEGQEPNDHGACRKEDSCFFQPGGCETFDQQPCEKDLDCKGGICGPDKMCGKSLRLFRSTAKDEESYHVHTDYKNLQRALPYGIGQDLPGDIDYVATPESRATKYETIKARVKCDQGYEVNTKEQCIEAGLAVGGVLRGGKLVEGDWNHVPCGCSIEPSDTAIHWDHGKRCKNDDSTWSVVCVEQSSYLMSGKGHFLVKDLGRRISMLGNVWKAFPISHTVSYRTVLEFDFRLLDEAEGHAICLDENLNEDVEIEGNKRCFRLAGTQEDVWSEVWKLPHPGNTGAYKHYKIRIGSLKGGAGDNKPYIPWGVNLKYLALIQDNDKEEEGKSAFRNLVLYEDSDAPKETFDRGTPDTQCCCSCNNEFIRINDTTGRPIGMQASQVRGNVMFQFIDNSKCAEAYAFTRSTLVDEFFDNSDETRKSTFAPNYHYYAKKACGMAPVLPGLAATDDLRISKLEVGSPYRYCVRAVASSYSLDFADDAPHSSDESCSIHFVRWQASMAGEITTEPMAGSLPIENVTVSWELMNQDQTVVIKSGSAVTKKPGKFEIEFDELHKELDRDNEFPVRIMFSKTTQVSRQEDGKTIKESIKHQFLCNEGSLDCTDEGAIVYLKHLTFDAPVLTYDNSSIPVRGRVTIWEPDGCPVIGADVCLKIKHTRSGDTEGACVKTDINGDYNAPATIGSTVGIEVSYFNHTIRKAPLNVLDYNKGIFINANKIYERNDFVDYQKSTLVIEVAGGLCNKTLGVSALEATVNGCDRDHWKLDLTQQFFKGEHWVPAHVLDVKVAGMSDSDGNDFSKIMKFFDPPEGKPMIKTIDLLEASEIEQDSKSMESRDGASEEENNDARKEEEQIDLIRFQYDGDLQLDFRFVGPDLAGECTLETVEPEATISTGKDTTSSLHVTATGSIFKIKASLKHSLHKGKGLTCDIVSDDLSVRVINKVGLDYDFEAYADAIKDNEALLEALQLCSDDLGCKFPVEHDERNGDKVNAHMVPKTDDGRLLGFTAGRPNIYGDYQKDFTIEVLDKHLAILKRHKAQVVVVGDYVLGPGASFALPTYAPLLVLRDPPGGLSSATYENVQTTVKVKSSSVEAVQETAFNFKVGIGAAFKLSTCVGFGAMVCPEQANVKFSGEVGLDVEHSAVLEHNEDTYTSEFTTTWSYSTSDDPVQAGRKSDIVVLPNLNVQYHTVETVAFYSEDACEVNKTEEVKFSLTDPQNKPTLSFLSVNNIEKYQIPKLESGIENKQAEQERLQAEGKTKEAEQAGDQLDYLKDGLAGWKQTMEAYDETNKKAKEGGLGIAAREWFSKWASKKDLSANEPSIADHWSNLAPETLTDRAKPFEFDYIKKANLDATDKADLKETNRIHFSGGGGTMDFSLDHAGSSELMRLDPSGSNQGISVGVSGGFAVNVEALILLDVGLEAGTTFQMSSSSTVADESSQSTTVSFVLGDEQADDEFVVDVFVDPTYGTFVFNTVGGLSMAPHEEGTLKGEDVRMSMEYPTRPVMPDDAIVFDVTVANDGYSLSVFQAGLDHTSNTGGLRHFLGGVGLEVPIDYQLSGRSEVTTTLEVRRGPQKYKYPATTLELGSGWDEKGIEAGSVEIWNYADEEGVKWIKFEEPCPTVEWAGSLLRDKKASVTVEKQPVGLTVFNPRKADGTLEEMANATDIRLEHAYVWYREIGDTAWKKAQLGSDYDLSQIDFADIPDSNWKESVYGYAEIPWDIGNLWAETSDGSYEITVESSCRALKGAPAEFNAFSTEPILLVVDRVRPELYGKALPIRGAVVPGEEVSLIFTESIQCELPYRFDLKVVVSGIDTFFDERNLLIDCRERKLGFQFDPTRLNTGGYDKLMGKEMTVTVDNIKDLEGNAILKEIKFTKTIANLNLREVSASFDFTLDTADCSTPVDHAGIQDRIAVELALSDASRVSIVSASCDGSDTVAKVMIGPSGTARRLRHDIAGNEGTALHSFFELMELSSENRDAKDARQLANLDKRNLSSTGLFKFSVSSLKIIPGESDVSRYGLMAKPTIEEEIILAAAEGCDSHHLEQKQQMLRMQQNVMDHLNETKGENVRRAKETDLHIEQMDSHIHELDHKLDERIHELDHKLDDLVGYLLESRSSGEVVETAGVPEEAREVSEKEAMAELLAQIRLEQQKSRSWNQWFDGLCLLVAVVASVSLLYTRATR